MDRYQLSFYKDGVFVACVTISDNEVIVGRAAECNIRLSDTMVSRRHARFWLEDNKLFVEDLGSRNGIFKNRQRIDKAELIPGDELAIGMHLVSIEACSEEQTLVDTGSLISFEEGKKLYDNVVKEEGKGYLPILYRAAYLMGSVTDLDQLLNEVLQVVIEAMRVRRGFIIVLSPETGEPKIRAALPEGEASVCPPLSKTMLRSVFEERSAVLTVNALEDKRFSGAESIIAHNIHSAMCVPLCGRNTLTGALYVDSGKDTVVFTNEDLELLTALGRVIGVAIENANLQEEKLRHERLAAIGQATAGIGHCVKGLLVGLKGGGEFIEKGINEKDWEWVEKGWDLVRRVSDRIEELVMNLLTYSRDPKPMFGPTDLKKVVEEALDLVRSKATRHRVTLELRTDADLGVALADNRDIFRVVMNLLHNAIDACEEKGGTVRINGGFLYRSVRHRHGYTTGNLRPALSSLCQHKRIPGNGLGSSLLRKTDTGTSRRNLGRKRSGKRNYFHSISSL